jgi:hypothetical protein
MKENEKKIYDTNLSDYSFIIKGKIKDKIKIKSCLEILEYFEDYEKCKDLDRVLKSLENNINGY